MYGVVDATAVAVDRACDGHHTSLVPALTHAELRVGLEGAVLWWTPRSPCSSTVWFNLKPVSFFPLAHTLFPVCGFS